MTISDILFATAHLSLPEAALEFAQAGVPVFPCVPFGKRPLTPNGFHAATTVEGVIARWWQQWPDANIGMPTGQATGVEVVDIDVRESGSGFAAFQRALDGNVAGGELARVRTPSDGMHAYYRSGSHPQRCWQAAGAHIDFRGDGGYILVPPSAIRTPSGPVAYRVSWLGSLPGASIDATALRAFIDPRPVPTAYSGTIGRTNPDVIAGWVSRLQEGERNRGLFWAACRLYESGMPPRDAMAVLIPAAAKTGLGEREIRATLSSAWHHTGPEGHSPKFTRYASPAAHVSDQGAGPWLR